MIGNLIDDAKLQEKVGYEGFDLAAANILTEVLLPLTPRSSAPFEKGRRVYYVRNSGGDRRKDYRGCESSRNGASGSNPSE